MKLIAGTTGDLLFVCAIVYQITKYDASILRFKVIKAILKIVVYEKG